MILLSLWKEENNDWGRQGGQVIVFYSTAC